MEFRSDHIEAVLSRPEKPVQEHNARSVRSLSQNWRVTQLQMYGLFTCCTRGKELPNEFGPREWKEGGVEHLTTGTEFLDEHAMNGHTIFRQRQIPS